MAQVSGPFHLKARNLYHRRWSSNISPTVEVGAKPNLDVHPVRVLHRFQGGMVYESQGKTYLLCEQIFGDFPFLFVFAVPGEKKAIEANRFTGAPDNVMQVTAKACERVVKEVKLPTNIHNIEADITRVVANYAQLPAEWSLTKAIMQVGILGGSVACDCDVDGPCGYCCDTCDCNSSEIAFQGVLAGEVEG